VRKAPAMGTDRSTTLKTVMRPAISLRDRFGCRPPWTDYRWPLPYAAWPAKIGQRVLWDREPARVRKACPVTLQARVQGTWRPPNIPSGAGREHPFGFVTPHGPLYGFDAQSVQAFLPLAFGNALGRAIGISSVPGSTQTATRASSDAANPRVPSPKSGGHLSLRGRLPPSA
jgi:hypothetical protein